jgi:antitoxin YefM
MITSFHLKAEELDEKFLKTVRALFKKKNISITIEEEMDETAHLLSTEANRRHLEAAIKNVKQGKITKVDIDKYLPK